MSVSTTAPAAVGASISTSYRDLVAAVKAVGLLAGGTRPAFPNIEVAAADQTLTLTSADTESAVSVTVAGSITGDEQRVMVSWAELSKLLPAAVKGTSKRQLDQLDINIDMTGESLTLGVAGYELPVTVAPEAQLPDMPATTPGTHVVDRDEFAAMFTRVVAAACTDELLRTFTMVSTDMTADSLTLTATDRYRMSRGSVACNGTAEQSVLLPGALIAKLLPFCDGDQITLGTDGEKAEWITLHSGSLTVKIHAHDGSFPRITHLFDMHNADTATVDRAEFRTAADRAKALTAVLADRNTAARIIVAPGTLTVAPGTRDDARTAAPSITADTHVDGTWTGGANPTYLVEAVAHLTGETVTLEFTAPGKPIKLTGDDTFEHVLMLMRLPQ